MRLNDEGVNWNDYIEDCKQIVKECEEFMNPYNMTAGINILEVYDTECDKECEAYPSESPHLPLCEIKFFDLLTLDHSKLDGLIGDEEKILSYEPRITTDSFLSSKKLTDDILSVSRSHLKYLEQAIVIGITLYDTSSNNKTNWANVIRDVSKVFPHKSPESFAAYCKDNCKIIVRSIRETATETSVYYAYDIIDTNNYYVLNAMRLYLRTIYKTFKTQEIEQELPSVGTTLHRLALGLQNEEDVIFGVSIFPKKEKGSQEESTAPAKGV